VRVFSNGRMHDVKIHTRATLKLFVGSVFLNGVASQISSLQADQHKLRHWTRGGSGVFEFYYGEGLIHEY